MGRRGVRPSLLGVLAFSLSGVGRRVLGHTVFHIEGFCPHEPGARADTVHPQVERAFEGASAHGPEYHLVHLAPGGRRLAWWLLPSRSGVWIPRGGKNGCTGVKIR
jgi:hypothetical protein